MNKRKLTKSLSLSKWFLFCFLTAGVSLTSCGDDYDDDIKRLEDAVNQNKNAIDELKKLQGGGKYVESITDNGDKITVNMSDGTKQEISKAGGAGGGTTSVVIGNDGYWYINGVKQNYKAEGESPTIGANGNWWVGDKDTGVKAKGENGDNSISVVEDPVSGDVVITIQKPGEPEQVIRLPKATFSVSGVKFVPAHLSQGEAARIHFPIILTDSIAGQLAIAGQDWTTSNYKSFGIIYSGKAELKYQVNPHSASFESFEVLGFARDTAEIWNYNTNDKQAMLFDKGQIFYTDGKLTKAKSYAEGFGVISFRAKDWAFAELNNLDQRTVYSLVLKTNDNKIHSDFVPAKHEVILQKNVYLVKKAEAGDQARPEYHTPTTPNAQDYLDFMSDDFYLNAQDHIDLNTFINMSEGDKLTVQNRPENLFYKGAGLTKDDPRIHFRVDYKETKDLKPFIMSFFKGDRKKTGYTVDSEWLLDQNGFDDYSLVFEPVDFYTEGVNQTERYLNLTKDGIVSATDKSPLDPSKPIDHTAAVNRTPIIRVKLVAPGEDNNNVVKTAIIKIIFTKDEKPAQNLTITYEKDVTLKHIDQFVNLDMDPLFNGTGLSKEQFRDTYNYVQVDNSAYYINYPSGNMFNRMNDVFLKDSSTGVGELNQLFVHVTNTAFHTDHIVYEVKGSYVPKPGKNAGIIDIVATVRVHYPEVVAPAKSRLNWVDDKHFVAHGRVDDWNNPTSYEMVSVLNDMFLLNNYNPYGTKVVDINDARATLSFELVDLHNNASNIADGEDNGVRLYRTTTGNWELALDPSDAGRDWINVEGSTAKRIKMRAVVSFNECVDGLYGTCTAGADAHHKYAKSAQDILDCDIINGQWPAGTWAISPITGVINNNHTSHPQDYANNAGVAPEEGRSTIVVAEFEAAFVTPMVVHTRPVAPLYDKYQGAENRTDLSKAFFIADYLWQDGGQQAYKDAHIIYDATRAGEVNANVTFDTDGWVAKWVPAFDADRNIHYYVEGAVFSDGTSLDEVNLNKISFYQDPNDGKWYVTWINNGQDIAQEFTINIGVCVNHKWGQNCGHSWKVPQRGHSTGLIQIPVKKYNSN